jgi:hypothetical protein
MDRNRTVILLVALVVVALLTGASSALAQETTKAPE